MWLLHLQCMCMYQWSTAFLDSEQATHMYLFSEALGAFHYSSTISCACFLVLARIHGRTLHKVFVRGSLSILPFCILIVFSWPCDRILGIHGANLEVHVIICVLHESACTCLT